VFLRTFISLYFLVFSLTSFAGSSEAKRWLKRMSMVVKTSNYVGTFVYIHNNNIESMRIFHRSDHRGVRERLLSLNGSAREIIRSNNVLTCILPDSKAVVVEKSRPRQYIPDALMNVNSYILKNYNINIIGNDRVMAKATIIIAITPKDKYRYGYRLWLDKSNAMLLKSDVVNEKGVAVEQFMFTHLDFKKQIDDSDLNPSISGKDYKWFGKKTKVASNTKVHQWHVTKLPKGFKESMYMEHNLPASRMPVEHLVFTDGLSTVSVYIEKPHKNKMPLMGTSNMGAVNAFGKSIAGYQVTVVGEVPKATVMMIGNAVAPIKK